MCRSSLVVTCSHLFESSSSFSSLNVELNGSILKLSEQATVSSIEKIRHGSQKRIILKILLTSLEKQDIKLSTQHHLINSFFHFSGKTNNLTKPNSTQHNLIKPSLERLLKVT